MSAYGDFQKHQGRVARSERNATAKAGGRHKVKAKAHKPHKPAYNRLDDPNAVTAPLTYRDINRNADTATNERYAPQERALGLQKAQVPAWFQNYRAQVGASNAAYQAGAQDAMTGINTRAQQAQTTDNAGRAQLLATAQADAAKRGATVDPSLFAADAGAGAVRRQGQNELAGLIGSEAQAQGGYYGNLQAASSAGELAQLARIGQQQRDVATDKGSYRSQYVTDAAQTEHKNRLEDEAFGLNTYKAQQTSKNQAAQRKSTSKNQAAQRRATSRTERNSVITSGAFAGLTHGEVRKLTPVEKQQKTDAFNKSKGKAGTKTKADTKASDQVIRIQDAEGRWNLYKNTKVTETVNGKDVKRLPTPTEIKQRLISEKFSTPEIHLALMWSSSKPWTAGDRATARRLGIKLPKRKPATGKARPRSGGGAGATP